MSLEGLYIKDPLFDTLSGKVSSDTDIESLWPVDKPGNRRKIPTSNK